MADRTAQIAAALAGTGWHGWQRLPLAGDASTRRYERLAGPDGKTAILLDSPAEDLAPFLRIAAHLRGIGLCPPEILWAEPGLGLAVISDLGPHHVAHRIDACGADAMPLYATAVDVLAVLQAHPAPPGLSALTPEGLGPMLEPLFSHYAPATPAGLAEDLCAALSGLMRLHAPGPLVLSLRDYHAENLIWRPALQGTDQIGLLDFQDAFLAPPAYDLCSLLHDARRDPGPGLTAAMLARFAAATGRDPGALAAEFAVLGLVRNLRILGIFARLARRDGKLRYLTFLPTTRAHVMTDLAHPDMAGLGPLIARILPEVVA